MLRNAIAIPVPSTRERSLLAVLLMRSHQVVTVDEAVDGVWGEHPPAHPKAALHTLLTRLRQRLGEPGVIRTKPGGYAIAPGYLDLEEFRARVAAAGRAAERRDPRAEAAQLGAALALWRGQLLADVPSDVLQRQFAPVLAEERLAALRRHLGAGVALGRSAAVVPQLRALTAEHPLQEWCWALLMLALHRADRRADALDTYRQARRTLRAELGVEPGRELRRMQARVLAGPAPSGSADTDWPTAG